VNRRSFLDVVNERVVLFDGGTGTEIYARGVFLNRCYEELNLTHPELVEQVHRSFLSAGSEAIESNSFAANRPKLEPHGLGEQVRELNRAAASIARRAAGARAFVAGSIGPLGIRLEPWGPTTLDEAIAIYREQVEGLLEGGVDLFLLETFGDLSMIQAAVNAVRSLAPDLPLIANMTVDEEGRSPEGVPAEWLGQKLARLETDLIGCNCSVGPAPMLQVIETFATASSRPLVAMPNAGLPRLVEGRTFYLSSPNYLASYAKRFVAAGARVIGGCCGVTPEHIRALAGVVEGLQPGRSVTIASPPLPTTPPRSAKARELRSPLAHKLYSGQFTSIAELSLPIGWQTPQLVSELEQLAQAGVNAVVIPDSSGTAARMNSLAMAQTVRRCAREHDLPLEVVLQYVCRNRTLHEMQSDLLGARALEIQHIWVVTGTTSRPGEGVWAAPDLDVDAIGLTNAISRLNHGLDIGDNPIGEPADLVSIVQVMPSNADFEAELRRLEWKIDAGADAVITTPVFDVASIQRLAQRIEPLRIPIIASLYPLGSLREAEYLAGEVPGVSVPAAVLERMREADATGRELHEARQIALELAAALDPFVEGIAWRGPHLAGMLPLLPKTRRPPRPARPFPGRFGVKR
jgi:homocysteine S-methyltransferase